MCFEPVFIFFDKSSGKREMVKFLGKGFPSKDFVNLPSNFELVQVPCQKCVGCRLDYAKSWATRIICETQSCSHNYFLTFTYDDLHLPYQKCESIRVDESTGEVIQHENFGVNVLVPKDISDFMKRFRREMSYHFHVDGIRFFVAGEYGESTLRPHYHMIIFNCPLPDLSYYKKSPAGFPLYNSDFLNKVWQKGFVVIGDVTYESAHYTARYTLKKLKGKDDLTLFPEFVRMSTHPGIGKVYFDQNKDKIYTTDSIILPSDGKVHCVRPPRYFDKLLEVESPDFLREVKDNRLTKAEFTFLDRCKSTDRTVKQLFTDMANTVKRRLETSLSRNSCDFY